MRTSGPTAASVPSPASRRPTSCRFSATRSSRCSATTRRRGARCSFPERTLRIARARAAGRLAHRGDVAACKRFRRRRRLNVRRLPPHAILKSNDFLGLIVECNTVGTRSCKHLWMKRCPRCTGMACPNLVCLEGFRQGSDIVLSLVSERVFEKPLPQKFCTPQSQAIRKHGALSPPKHSKSTRVLGTTGLHRLRRG